jgi:glutathionyl-hydroquinone reductase
MARFDTAYVTIMNCNWKQIRSDYPNLHRWLRQLYWEADNEAKGSFKDTTQFDIVSIVGSHPRRRLSHLAR